MKRIYYVVITALLFTACSEELGDSPSISSAPGELSFAGSTGGGTQPDPSGVITAGEWNDLEAWDFWKTLLTKDDFKSKPQYWNFFPSNRVAVKVVGSNGLPAVDVIVKLKKEGSVVYTARTDNKGKAEMWIDLFQQSAGINLASYSIDINNGEKIVQEIQTYEQGVNEIALSEATPVNNHIEISFVVDATGSMGDELEYLKKELYDVITRAKSNNPNNSVSLSSVFYKDHGDEYVTRRSGFSDNTQTTIDFINHQSADGGGDTPEAVELALDDAINALQWSESAKTRLLFLVLDAPPHYTDDIKISLNNLASQASAKGIKIIPITASGIDKETEFLMRFLSVSTNGTYVFITGHSGIGGEHLEPSIGEYEVEFLNNLMVRLITKYSE